MIKLKKMRKFILTLLIAGTTGLYAFASHVPVSLAKIVAKNYFIEKCFVEKNSFEFEKAVAVKHNSEIVYYVFNTKDNKGFIIVSGDDAYTPVIGYSPTGQFIIEDRPASIDYWMNNYKETISGIINQKLEANEKTKQLWAKYSVPVATFTPAKKGKAVEPLTETILWNQDGGSSQGFSGGWDYFTPEGTPTGCVATAMSIIMYYWKYPTQGVGSHSYYHYPTGTHTANFGETTYFYSNMLDDAPTYYSALLSYHAGVSVDMDYDPEGSGAYSQKVLPAMKNYFNYANTCILRDKEYATDAQWKAWLKEEFDATPGRPVYYAGSDPEAGGHAYICDGYDDSDNFHFNFGWGGFDNGYYTLDVTGQFTQGFRMITGIQPKAANYPYNNTVEEFTATLNTNNETNFEVNLAWTAPAKKRGLTGYQLYRGEDELTEVDASTTSYSDNSLTQGLSDYYAVRPLYSDGDALCKSAFVKGAYTVNFSVLNAQNQPVVNAEVTFDGRTKTTGYSPIDFQDTPWGHNYEYTVSHSNYKDVTGTLPIVNADVTHTIYLEPAAIEDGTDAGVLIYPNPASGQLFIQADFSKNTEYSILDITGRQIAQGILKAGKNAIDVSNFDTGMYFVNINSLSINHKIIIK